MHFPLPLPAPQRAVALYFLQGTPKAPGNTVWKALRALLAHIGCDFSGWRERIVPVKSQAP